MPHNYYANNQGPFVITHEKYWLSIHITSTIGPGIPIMIIDLHCACIRET